MTDVLFYQLLLEPLERVLPGLLEKTLERGWRAVVQCGSVERMNAMNNHLWTYTDESFLPHGTGGEGSPENQPIYLTVGEDNPNDANVRFLIDGSIISDARNYERIVYLFDGNDPDALSHARERWKAEKAAGHDVTYWAQSENRKWERKA